MYLIKENFLNDDECNHLIGLYKEVINAHYSKEVCFNHRDTTVFNIDKFLYVNYVEDITHDRLLSTEYNITHYLRLLQAKITNHIQNISNDLFINFFQVVEWPPGSYQEVHIDYQPHVFTSIIYLNDDYEGGETIVGNDKVTPKKGSIITFPGNKIHHSVTKVLNKTRYTLPIWYRSLKV